MSESTALAACPFCGGAMQFRKALWPSDGCTDAVIHAEPSDCGMHGFDIGTTDESVIGAWNRRASLAEGKAEPAPTNIRERAKELRRELVRIERLIAIEDAAAWRAYDKQRRAEIDALDAALSPPSMDGAVQAATSGGER